MKRYQRQIRMEEIGEEGQKLLSGSSVLVIGAGGLGSPCLQYLASVGIGKVGIVDDDIVEESNLQRQVLYSMENLGLPKTESAVSALSRLNPGIEYKTYQERFSAENSRFILHGWDFVVDATDNFDSKFLISDRCVDAGIPFSHAGIDRFRGQAITVMPGMTACYRCVFANPPDYSSPPPAGPVGALAGIIGSIQAMEAIKVILGIGEPLVNRMLTFDSLTMSFRTVSVSRRKNCPACSGACELQERWYV